MYNSENFATKAAKKSSHVKDNGSFLVVYFPHRNSYGYFTSEEWAWSNGRPEYYIVLARYTWKGLFKGWVKEEIPDRTGNLKPEVSLNN